MRKSMLFAMRLLLSFLGVAPVSAQYARLRSADPMYLPPPSDGNSAFFWWNGQLKAFTSIGFPIRLHTLTDPVEGKWDTEVVDATDLGDKTAWVERAWSDEMEGAVFGWYHHEPGGLVPGTMLTAPRIGALVSFDGGRTVRDLGFILESGDPINPDAQNGFFVGGHGDLSVVLDREHRYFYFFFTNYGGPSETQGVCVARLAFEDRFDPAGKVRKYFEGAWNEPGLGGRVTPIHRSLVGWDEAEPDAFWGPSVHWNTYLNRYVMLLNHAQGSPGWAQEGIYVSYLADLENPEAWTEPVQLLGREEIPTWATFYPEVLGLEPGGTDAEAGQVARFFLNGASYHEIEFIPSEQHRRRGRRDDSPRS